MAEELQLTIVGQLANGAYQEQFAPGTLKIDQSTRGGISQVVQVGTSDEAISLGDVSTEGVCFLQNLDDTNFVTFGPDSGGSIVALGMLKPGEVAALRLSPGLTLRMQANTAECRVKCVVFED